MKKSILFVSLFMIFSVIANAQGDIKSGWGDLNYAVPESPGFKILGTSPSNIMKPTSVKDIAFSVGNYFATNGSTIPQNLAVEISPSLFKPKLGLKEFSRNRIWYTSALSIGTKVNTDKSYAIGIGLKFDIINKQDLRLMPVLLHVYDSLLNASTDAYLEEIRAVGLKHMQTDTAKRGYSYWLGAVNNAYQTANPVTSDDQALKKEVTAYIKSLFFMDKVNQIRDSVKKNSWNKPIWDLGVAALFNSKDSLLRNIKPASKLGLWTTAGFPLFGTKGQLLIGVTGQVRDTVNSRLGVKSLNIGSRAYYGSNDVKGFVEANSLFQTNQKFTYKASLGIETTFFGGMWVDFSLGLSKQGGAKAVFTPGFNLFFGNGEKKSNSTGI